MPWESLLSLALSSLGGPASRPPGLPQNAAPVIVRRLKVSRSTADSRPTSTNNNALAVISAPGELERELTALEVDLRMLEGAALGSPGASVKRLVPPSLAALRSEVTNQTPEIVHFAGFDSHQGAQLLKLEPPPVLDGVILASGQGTPAPATAEELARELTAAELWPRLFTCNTHRSGARIASLAVAAGCGHAIGFQDEIDATVAQVFFERFYRAWYPSRDTLAAFELALRDLQEQNLPMRGSGIILWSAESLVAVQDPVSYEQKTRSVGAQLSTGSGTGEGAPSDLQVVVQPLEEINYSLLHNGRSLFRQFSVYRFDGQPLRNIEVDVVLRVGREEVSATRRFDLRRSTGDLTEDLPLPLTWEAGRFRESVLTNLEWTVKSAGTVVRKDSAQVRLLPINAWRDDPRDWAWLPSFVMPRDPAVVTVVDRAQKYLVALSDDRRAGFDGYQSGDEDYVDLQVRAIWSALVLDFELHYIEPPPSYAERSQRLRYPTMVIGDRRGTCIDLALLFCSCLEYVGIGSTIFLLRGHSFPAYWRTPQGPVDLFHSRARLLGVGAPDPEESSQSSQDWSDEPTPWVYVRPADDTAAATRFDQALFGPHESESGTHYGPLLAEELVPIETVLLAEQSGIGLALEAGWRNLEVRSDIEAMIDVPSARGQLAALAGEAPSDDDGPRRWLPVTPLPFTESV